LFTPSERRTFCSCSVGTHAREDIPPLQHQTERSLRIAQVKKRGELSAPAFTPENLALAKMVDNVIEYPTKLMTVCKSRAHNHQVVCQTLSTPMK